ncbi:MAG: response regulator [Anaerolineae bacterium]
MSSRILVVDDAQRIVHFFSVSLERVGDGYEVLGAFSAEEALELMAEEPVDLLVSDLRLPGLDGLTLIQQARDRVPDLPAILFTAFDSEDVRSEANRIGVNGYLVKPFSIEDLIDEVTRALPGQEPPPLSSALSLSPERMEALTRPLSELRFEVGAQCVLLADVLGNILVLDGITVGFEPATLVSLLAGGHATTMELAKHLGEEDHQSLNYHEGDRLDVYSSNVGDSHVLIIVNDRQAGTSRLGNTWLYSKRAIPLLVKLLGAQESPERRETLGEGLGDAMRGALDDLFPKEPEEAEEDSPAPEREAPDQAEDVWREESIALEDEPPPDTVGLSDARALGLIDEKPIDPSDPQESGEENVN